MVSRSILVRIARVEAHSGIEFEPPTTVFVETVDARSEEHFDPDDPTPLSRIDHTDDDVIGVWEWRQQGRRLSRKAGETVEALHARAAALMPRCRLFFNAYGSSDQAAFDAAIEATDGQAARS